MTDAKYTPGPWSVGHTNPKDYGGGIIHYYTSVHVGSGTNRSNALATVGMGGPGATVSTPETVQANARLIAAAPELYAALERFMEIYNEGQLPSRDALEMAEAALAKVSGE